MTRQILPVPNPVSSYWLSEPHGHARLRTTPRLPENSGIVVVGAGLAGVLSAYHILKNLDREGGEQAREQEQEQEQARPPDNDAEELHEQATRPAVLLLDARELCSGATARNGGHIKVQVSTLLNLPILAGVDRGASRTAFHAYVCRVMREIKRIVEEEGIECEFELRRSFDVFTDAADAQRVHAEYLVARARGEAWTGDVSWVGEDRAEQVTSVRGAKGAFSVPCASFWPYKFVTGLLGVMVRRWGGSLNVQMCTPVLSLATSSAGAATSHVLTTERGAVVAAKVVLATNAYTAGLLPRFRKAIVPVRGMASHHAPAKPVHPHLTNTYNTNFGPGKGVDYLNPRPDGGIVVGGGSWLFRPDKDSWEGNWDDSRLFPEQVTSYWKEYMRDCFLGWEDGAANDIVWTGIMGRTSDGQPLVGRVPGKKGAWVLAGFNGGGMGIIALCARAVGRMVVRDEGFEEVWAEEGLLKEFGCTQKRLG